MYYPALHCVKGNVYIAYSTRNPLEKLLNNVLNSHEKNSIWTLHNILITCTCRAWVIVRVTDKDESIPKFDKDAYIIELEEKRMYDNVLKVSALDLDRSPEFGEICDYKILTPNEPFSIDSTG